MNMLVFSFCMTLLTSGDSITRDSTSRDSTSRDSTFSPLPPTHMDFIFSSVDAGQSWQNIGTGLPGKLIPISIFATEGRYYLGTTDGLYKGTALIPLPKWEKTLSQQREITGIYPGKEGPYVVSRWNGFYQYYPAVGLMASLHDQLSDKTVNTALETSKGIIYAGCETGIYKSGDKGKSWQQVFSKVSISRLVELDNVIMACGEGNLWRSTDGGAHWDHILLGAYPHVFIERLGDDLVTILEGQNTLGIRMPNMVYLSSDKGATWKELSNLPLSLTSIYEMCQTNQYLFAGSNDGIFRSSDRGVTWESVKYPPAGIAGFYKMFVADQTLFALFVEGC